MSLAQNVKHLEKLFLETRCLVKSDTEVSSSPVVEELHFQCTNLRLHPHHINQNEWATEFFLSFYFFIFFLNDSSSKSKQPAQCPPEAFVLSMLGWQGLMPIESC